ncbi:MAG: AbrB/MazE/SpoVT family DNA-binding domain-containing protein [Euryarchaeota archaeon]|nr:AbrB/MazE/SpoVT family DNA-binding domain-containing protein [Euryarchaeota archaeon]
MQVQTARLSSKGQITLPIEILRALNAGKGTEFLVVQEDDRIVLVKADSVGRKIVDELAEFSALGEGAFRDLWDNDADAIWDEA